ncbi:hypothetical protein OIU77_006153 [Salix suchowensis]|uniref:Uncharacterized protein n=1 Tax=Salix suchowensis TaxID=1278906 RepID=A0ABQ9AS22_9ROSI|nr:hypothetical protein OIU77_006153 [Salix suchowensis]
MAKRKAKKKSPLSSRPPPSHPNGSGPSPPTKKHARHSSSPPLSRVVDLATLAGPNWLASDLGPSDTSLAAADSAAGSLALHASGATPSQQPRPRPQAIEFSPTLAELYAPVSMDSPRDSEYEGSSSSNSDSSSHYGDNRSPAWDSRSTARGTRSTARARFPPPARKDGLISEGAAASLVDGRVQDATSLAAGMVFEAPAPASDLARQYASSSIKPSAPLNSEDATADCEWQPVPKKLASNRQPKSVLGSSAVLVPGSVTVASKGKAVLSAGNDLGLFYKSRQ